MIIKEAGQRNSYTQTGAYGNTSHIFSGCIRYPTTNVKSEEYLKKYFEVNELSAKWWYRQLLYSPRNK